MEKAGQNNSPGLRACLGKKATGYRGAGRSDARRCRCQSHRGHPSEARCSFVRGRRSSFRPAASPPPPDSAGSSPSRPIRSGRRSGCSSRPRCVRAAGSRGPRPAAGCFLPAGRGPVRRKGKRRRRRGQAANTAAAGKIFFATSGKPPFCSGGFDCLFGFSIAQNVCGGKYGAPSMAHQDCKAPINVVG